jgi:tape measure domain-containing protein
VANGGFEIPVEFITSIESQGQTLQQFFNQVEREGVDAVNKIAKAAGQPIKQVVEFEVKDGKLQQSLKETYGWTQKVERAQQQAARKEAQAQKQAATQRRAQITQLERIRKAHFKSLEAVDKVGTAAKKTGNALETAGKKGQQGGMAIVSGFIKAQVVMRAVSEATAAVGRSIAGMVERMKQVEGLTVAFKAFGLSAADAASALEFSKSIAYQYGAELSQMDKVLRRITPTIVTMGGNLNDSMIITEALAKRTAALGLNTEQAGRFMEAFAQVMGKGKLQSEELNQQFAELDGALRGQVAAYLKANHGITDLNQAMQDGEVKAGMFAAAVVDSSQNMTALSDVDLSNMVEQLRSGEITLQQFDNVLEAMSIDTFSTMSEAFAETIIQFKQLQVAWDTFANSAAGENAFVIIDGAIRTLISSINGLMLLVMAVDKAFRDMFNYLAEKLPFLEGVGEVISNMGKGISKWWAQSEKDTAAAIQGFKKVDQAVGETAKTTDELSGALKNYGKNTGEATEESKALSRATSKASEVSLGFANTVKSEYEALARRKSMLGDNAEANGIFQADLKDLNSKVRDQVNAVDASIASWKALAQENSNYSSQAASKIAMLEAEKKAINEQVEIGKLLVNSKVQQVKASNQSANVVQRERTELEKLTETMKKQEAQVAFTVQTSQNLLNSFSAFGQATRSLGSAFGSLDEQTEYLTGSIDDQISAVDAAIKSYMDFVMAGGVLSESQRELVDELNATKKALDEVANAGPTTGGKFTVDAAASFKAANENSSKTYSEFQREAMESQMLIDEADRNIERAAKSQALSAKALEYQAAGFTEAAGILEEYVRSFQFSSRQMRAAAAAGPIPLASGARAAGGPVASGSTYQVNELGREGFLSASGRMSEIKVPAYGSWTAPSKGEVIPAHVWAEMKAASAMGQGGTPAGLAGASRRASAGSSSVDNSRVTNHVTIQSQSPVQAASELMVASAKRRRRRFH